MDMCYFIDDAMSLKVQHLNCQGKRENMSIYWGRPGTWWIEHNLVKVNSLALNLRYSCVNEACILRTSTLRVCVNTNLRIRGRLIRLDYLFRENLSADSSCCNSYSGKYDEGRCYSFLWEGRTGAVLLKTPKLFFSALI